MINPAQFRRLNPCIERHPPGTIGIHEALTIIGSQLAKTAQPWRYHTPEAEIYLCLCAMEQCVAAGLSQSSAATLGPMLDELADLLPENP